MLRKIGPLRLMLALIILASLCSYSYAQEIQSQCSQGCTNQASNLTNCTENAAKTFVIADDYFKNLFKSNNSELAKADTSEDDYRYAVHVLLKADNNIQLDYFDNNITDSPFIIIELNYDCSSELSFANRSQALSPINQSQVLSPRASDALLDGDIIRIFELSDYLESEMPCNCSLNMTYGSVDITKGFNLRNTANLNYVKKNLKKMELDLTFYQYLPCRPISVDIKPGLCPNLFNPSVNGDIPVSIAGTKDFDVTNIDPNTIKLCFGNRSISPLSWSYADVSRPFEGKACNCQALGPDGIIDLNLIFNIQQMNDELKLPCSGEALLSVSGRLKEDSETIWIEGQDCIKLPCGDSLETSPQVGGSNGHTASVCPNCSSDSIMVSRGNTSMQS